MPTKLETRNLQIRASQGEEFVLAGRALKYSEISSNELAPGVRERVMPGAFKKSLANGKDKKALLNHNSSGLPLGRLQNGTLQITDSDDGLDFKIQLDRNNGVHRDVYASVKRGDISECSFSFQCNRDDYTDGYTKDGESCQIRNIYDADLFDVSVVNSPFYGDDATNVNARSAASATVNGQRARLATIDQDFRNREKLNEISLQLLEEKRKETKPDGQNPSELDQYQHALDDFASGRYRAVGASDTFIYGVLATSNPDDGDDDDSAEENALRFPFKKFADGKIRVLGKPTCLRPEDVASAAAPRFFDKGFESRANERLELKRRMRSLAGIVSV